MKEFSIEIKPDKEGHTGRECPKCEKYFKIKFGTGLPDATDCHCPYCNQKLSAKSQRLKVKIASVTIPLLCPAPAMTLFRETC